MNPIPSAQQTDPRLLALATDFPLFAKTCLKITDKAGKLVPFVLNRGQLFLHEHIKAHAAKRNDIIRIVLVKGRQGGYSTFVNGWNYHRTLFSRGRSTFVLAHLASASAQMFRIVNTFHDHLPDALKAMFPLKTNNRNQFEVDGTHSRILVGTAGSETSGRGSTIQSLHGSEVAFWQSPDDIITGLFNTVPDLPGTSIILESTANGVGTFFHNMASAGLSDDPTTQYETVFCPWFWQPEYSSPVPSGFKRTDEEHHLSEMYGLDDGQLVWRRRKLISECHGVTWKFQQEYPCIDEDEEVMTGRGLVKMKDVVAGDVCAQGVVAANLDKGEKECVQVDFKSGASFVCTPDHRVLTVDGWTEAQNLVSKSVVLAEHAFHTAAICVPVAVHKS